jgi:hypothetical protein
VELASRTIEVAQGEEVVVLPIGDIQYAGEGSSTALNHLKNDINWGLKHNAYFIGMGDYTDFASPSNRQRLASAALYDTANDVIELSAANITKELYERALKPSTNRWLGLLEGHHFFQYGSGITTDMELCDMLKARHLGTSAYVRLEFQDKVTRKRGPNRGRMGNITLWAHHGAGSGNRAGSPLNRLDQLPIYWDADIYLMGHQTKRPVSPLQRVEPVWRGNAGPFLKHRTIYIAGTGGYAKAYVAGNRHGRIPRGDYVEQKMLNPASLGCIKIRIVANWDAEFGEHGDRHWNPKISIEV